MKSFAATVKRTLLAPNQMWILIVDEILDFFGLSQADGHERANNGY